MNKIPSTPTRILIVEDEVIVRRSVQAIAESVGAVSTGAGSVSEALKCLSEGIFDIVFMDLSLPDGDGLSLIPEIRKQEERAEIVVLTGTGDSDRAEKALKSGAWDFLLKPVSPREIKLILNRAIDYHEQSKKTARPVVDRIGIIGNSPEIIQILDVVARASLSDASVLITGETGTGKELFAHAIHRNSTRVKGPFVIVDCASLTDTIVESILFGSKKGAFTGADKDRTGLIQEADGGTLFLDEAGEMPMSVQKTFLRVLQEKTFRPVGSLNEIQANFRLVSATNKNLSQMVEKGTYREDLFFRMSSSHIEIPPLRNQKTSLEELILHFIDRLSEKYRAAAKGFTPDFLETLTLYEWPGNVRELIGALEHAFSSGLGEQVLYPIHLPVNIRVAVTRNAVDKKQGTGPEAETNVLQILTNGALPTWNTYKRSGTSALQRKYFKDLLDHCNGDFEMVSNISGLGRARLYELLKKHGIKSQSDIPEKSE
ncbi:MAG: sigma-54 dependent transcriptional regulator [Leptospira sp.]|nr:sigma-54 dependent transcriptional regulator [Leptospira sp.]